MNVLVIAGAGYIGAHLVFLPSERGETILPFASRDRAGEFVARR